MAIDFTHPGVTLTDISGSNIYLSDLTNPSDEVIFITKFDPGQDSTLDWLAYDFTLNSPDSPSQAVSVTTKLDINPQGLGWENIASDTTTWNNSTSVHMEGRIAAASLTNAKAPMDVRLTISGTGAGTYDNGTSAMTAKMGMIGASE